MTREEWKVVHRAARTMAKTSGSLDKMGVQKMIGYLPHGFVCKTGEGRYYDTTRKVLSFEEEAWVYHKIPPKYRPPTVWLANGTIQVQEQVHILEAWGDEADRAIDELLLLGFSDFGNTHNMGTTSKDRPVLFDWGILQLNSPLHRYVERRVTLEAKRKQQGGKSFST